MIKGEVTIIKRNLLNEVIEKTTYENTATSLMPYGLMQSDDTDDRDFRPQYWRIGIAGSATLGKLATKEMSSLTAFEGIILLSDLGVGLEYARKFPNGSPAPYWEFNGRLPIATPGNEETFNHVLLGTTAQITRSLAYVVLDPACVQEPNEVIDFVYRLYFYEDALSDRSTFYGIQNYWKHIFNAKITDASDDEWLATDTDSNNNWVPHWSPIARRLVSPFENDTRRFETFWNSGNDLLNIPANSNTAYNFFNSPSADLTSAQRSNYETADDSTWDFSRGYRNIDLNPAKISSFNGKVFASIRAGHNLIPFLPANNYLYDNINYNSPIQVIHNHNKNAIRMASDVDFLAGSSSRPNANGTIWTNPDFPKQYRLEVNGVGDTGASTHYNFAVRDFIITDNDPGTGNELYWTTNDGTSVSLPWSQGLYTQENSNYVIGSGNDPLSYRELKAIDSTIVSSGVGMHGITNVAQFCRFRYNSDLAKTHIMSHDFDGITLTNIHKGWFWNFDSARTNMNFSYLTQLATDANNNIWCCDRNEGLVRISDIIGTPTANAMTTATNSIQTGDCYGVCFTGNNRIYAMFEGGLVYSDNPTLNDSNSITFTNSTFTARSSERSNITGLIGDPEHPDHHLAVMFANTTVSATDTNQDVFWYTGSTETTVKSDNVLTNTNNYVKDYQKIRDGLFLNQKYGNVLLHCSDKNSVWFGLKHHDAGAVHLPGLFTFNNVPYYPNMPVSERLASFGTYGFAEGAIKLDSALNFNGVPYVQDIKTDSGSFLRSFLQGCYSLPEGSVFKAFNFSPNQSPVSNATEFEYPRTKPPYGTSIFFPNSTGVCLTATPIDSISPSQAGYYHMGISNFGSPEYTRDETTDRYGGEISNPVSWNGRGPLQRAIAWRRYGWNGSTWVEGYGQPFDDTTANNTDLKRIGFDWNSPIFAGDAYCDGSELFNNVIWGPTDDATFAFSLDLRDKYNHADTGQCVFDFHEPYTDNRISLWMNFKNRYSVNEVADGINRWLETRTSENIVLIVNATANTAFVDTGIDGSTYWGSDELQFNANTRVVVTVNNTSANLYVNGTEIGGVTLNNPIKWQNLDGNAKFYIGTDAISDITGTSLPMHFVNGRITDFSVNNDEWTTGEIENDYTSHSTSGTTTVPAGNLVAQWLMKESLQDGKQTHTNEEEIEDGIKVAWPSFIATPSASWEDGDYWTFVVSEGIFKDNTNEFNWTNYEYLHPVDYNFTEITDPGVGQRTDRVMFSGRDEMFYTLAPDSSNLFRYTGSNLGHVFGFDDSSVYKQIKWYSLPCDSSSNFTFNAFIETSNTAGSSTSVYECGIFVSSNPTAETVYNSAHLNFSYWLNPHATIAASREMRIYESGTLSFTDASSDWKIGDKLTIERIGTTVTYYRNGVVQHTTTSTPNANYYIGVGVGRVDGGGWSNVEFTYTPPSNVKFIGNNGTKTGYQDKDFFRIHTEDINAFTINGTDAEVVYSNDFYLNKPAPGANQVILDDVGYIVVNGSDTGKTFTANVVLGYTNHPGPDY